MAEQVTPAMAADTASRKHDHGSSRTHEFVRVPER